MKTVPVRLHRWLLVCGFHAVIFTAIFAANHLAQLFHFFDRHESFVWFPAGISIGLLQRYGLRTVASVCFGLFAYYVGVYQLPLWAAAWTSITWACSLFAFHRCFSRFCPDDIFAAPKLTLLAFYAFGIGLAPVIHTVLDWPMMSLGGMLDPNEDIRSYAFSYFLGEAYSVLLLTPAVYLFGRNFEEFYDGPAAVYSREIRQERVVWSVLVAAFLLLTSYFGQQHFYAGIQDIEYLLYPMLAWSALRLGVMFTNVAVIAVTLSVFVFTAFGIAGTPAPLTNQTMIGLLTFIFTIAVMAQLLAVLDLERRFRSRDLAYAGTHDWLTSLGNVPSFRRSVTRQIEQSRVTGRRYALGYIEVNEHKVLEQGYGLRARNALLRLLSAYLTASFSMNVELARISGGSFSVLFGNADFEQAKAELEEVLRRLHSFRFVWGKKIYRVAPTIRLAPIDSRMTNPDRLLEWISGESEPAESRGEIVVLRRDSVSTALQQRRKLVHWLPEIQDALEQDRFQLTGQRIQRLALSDGTTPVDEAIWMEILVRMRTATGEVLLPDQFLPHAERYGLLPQLDRWVFTHVCQWLLANPSYLARVAKVSINISGQSLGDRNFRTTLLDYLQKTPLPLSKLCFEITETEAISNLESAVALFKQLRGLGASVSLDDFGTGLSSFEYLKHFGLEYLKIDGIFVRGIEPGSQDYVIVKAIQSVAAAMHIETVAEYVENVECVACLRELGIDYAQGYAIGKPTLLNELFAVSSTSESSPLA